MAPEEKEFDIFSWNTIFAIVVVIILFTSIFFGYDILSGTQEPFEVSSDITEEGDTVLVNYTGRLGGPDGPVFDTTMESVAKSSQLARMFKEKANYQPYKFVIGVGAKIMEKDMPLFEEAVMGMNVGGKKSITIPAGFGEADPDLVETIDLVEKLPLFTDEFNITQFFDEYGISPQVGLKIKHHQAGWGASVYFVDNNDRVIIRHEPTVGEVVDFNGAWSSEVISIDNAANGGDGEITIRHMLSPSDVGVVHGSDDNGDFILSGLDTAAGTATLDYNIEGAGMDLYFEITLVGIENA